VTQQAAEHTSSAALLLLRLLELAPDCEKASAPSAMNTCRLYGTAED